jgi:hypothetical protein
MISKLARRAHGPVLRYVPPLAIVMIRFLWVRVVLFTRGRVSSASGAVVRCSLWIHPNSRLTAGRGSGLVAALREGLNALRHGRHEAARSERFHQTIPAPHHSAFGPQGSRYVHSSLLGRSVV